MDSQIITINNEKKILKVTNACLDNSDFFNISAKSVKIVNANLSNLEIEGAQLGGAYIHNIGLLPKGHPGYSPDAIQRPLKFENCDLNNTTITNCNLGGIAIDDCNIKGMAIFGIPVEDLLKEYRRSRQ